MNELASLLRHVPVSDHAKDAVVRRLHEPHRWYHNLDHVVEMWCWHNEYKGERFTATEEAIVASFCLYHDAIYDPQALGDRNEQASADLWLADSIDTTDYATRIAVDESIIASSDHFGFRDIPHEPVFGWCLDLDLLRLGSIEFDDHGRRMRAEYGHLTDPQWIKASAEFRAKVMAQPRIFRFTEFTDAETRARRNLAQALLQDWQHLGYLSSSRQKTPAS